MLRASAEVIARVTGGTLLLGESDTQGIGVAIDSRACEPGSVFVALAGEHTDGHEYLRDAMEASARIVIVSRPPESLVHSLAEAARRGMAVVSVADGLRALQELAAWHRARLLCPVIGVTGSTGKTTTKDFLRAALATTMKVASTKQNRNNELGVPLTILEAGTDIDVLILEMGMRGRGQIAELCRIARPTMGLVTNVGSSHVELLGSLDAIADAKGELARAIDADGAVFLNGDDGRTPALAALAKAPVTRYGLASECDVRAEDISLDEQGRASFTIRSPQGSTAVDLPIPGRHNVYNALAAAAVALRLAVPLEMLAEGLGDAEMTGMRMESFVTAAGVTVINDAYNANPTSMRAAIETLASIAVTGKRIAVLGDMAELGGLADVMHLETGEEVARHGIDALITVGRRSRRIAEGARAAGMQVDMIRPCATVEEAVEVLDDLVASGDVVLVKASRVMGFERVVEGLVDPRVG